MKCRQRVDSLVICFALLTAAGCGSSSSSSVKGSGGAPGSGGALGSGGVSGTGGAGATATGGVTGTGGDDSNGGAQGGSGVGVGGSMGTGGRAWEGLREGLREGHQARAAPPAAWRRSAAGAARVEEPEDRRPRGAPAAARPRPP